MQDHSISVVVPAYNEAQYVKESVTIDLDILNHSSVDYELIIVDDGSTDATADIIRETFSDTPNVKIFVKPGNEGYGGAVRFGIRKSIKDYILPVPVDSPLTEEVFQQFMDNIGKGDILLGYRTERKGYTLRMNITSIVYHFLISTLFGLKLKDYNWIHLYPSRIFKENRITISSAGIFMLAEVLIKANRLGYSFYEFPVDHQIRTTGVATASSFKNALITFKDMLSFKLFGKS